MLAQLLPQPIDNRYRGFKFALWLLGALVFMKGAMGMGCIFNGYAVATSADGIPLDAYSAAGAQAVVAMFALGGCRGCSSAC